MVGLLQIRLLVDVVLLITPLISCMLSIKLGFLLLRLSDLNRTMKVGVWSRVMLSTIIWLTMVSSRPKLLPTVQLPQIKLEAAVESEQQWFKNIEHKAESEQQRIKNMESLDSSEVADVRYSEGVLWSWKRWVKKYSGPRCFTRSTAGQFISKRFIEEVFCSIISGSSASSYCSQLMHLAKGNPDVNTREVQISDPRV